MLCTCEEAILEHPQLFMKLISEMYFQVGKMGLSFFKDANAIIFFSDLIGYCKVHWKSCFYFGVTSNILNTLNLEMGCMNPTHTSSMDLVKMLTRKHQFQKCNF